MAPRIGFGYDVHQLKEGYSLVLGGVQVPHEKGCVAHSDGDVLVHAICDAILGAANARDIGFHFPDTSQDFEGIDSTILLEKTIGLIQEKGYMVGNIDCTICMQRPKLRDYIPLMVEKLTPLLQAGGNSLSIKATTTEKLGFVGKEEGVSAYAVALLLEANEPG